MVEPDLDAYPPFHAILRLTGIEVSAEQFAAAGLRASSRVEPLRYQLLGKSPSYLDRNNIEILRELGVPDPDGAIVSRLHLAYTAPGWRREFPETIAALTALSDLGARLHLVSNSSDMLLEVVARRGWSAFFRSVTFSQEVGAEKPDRRVFDFAVRRAGGDALKVVHVGDSWRADYLGAKEAGLRAIWFNRDGLDAPEPCEEIRNLNELPRRLRLI